MWGEPKDVEGECNAHLYIADNYGDNHATMRCQRPKGHPAHHSESFRRDGKGVAVQWERDERDYRTDAEKAADIPLADGIPGDGERS